MSWVAASDRDELPASKKEGFAFFSFVYSLLLCFVLFFKVLLVLPSSSKMFAADYRPATVMMDFATTDCSCL